MQKRSTYEVQERILLILKESSATYAQLERKANTGYRTIKQNCEMMEHYGLVEVEKTEHHPANGKPSYKVKITNHGRKTLEK